MSETLEISDYYRKVRYNINTKIHRFIVFDDSKGFNVLFVTREDNVYGFGSNFYGGLGFGHENQIQNPTKVHFLCKKNIQQFIPGTTFVLAMDDKNSIFSFSKNDVGQLGRGYFNDFSKAQVAGQVLNFTDKTITQISCGSSYALALTSDGQVYGWGDNSKGQLGCCYRDNKAIATPILITTLLEFNIKSIQCAFDQTYALTAEGQVLSWGWNTCCQLGHELALDEIVYEPMIINISNVKSVCPAFRNTYFLTNDGLLYFCGIFIDENKENTKPFQLTPKRMDTDLRFDSITGCLENQNIWIISSAMSENRIFCLSFDRIIRTKYYTYFDCYSNEAQMTLNTINADERDPELNRLSIERLLFIHITGQAYEKHKENSIESKTDESLIESSNIYQLFPVFEHVDSMSVQNIKLFHIFDDWRGLNVIYVRNDDKVYGFGTNSCGSLGFGHNRAVEEPQPVLELWAQNIMKFYNGFNFGFAQNQKKQLFSWGWNIEGQLGRGSTSKWNEYSKPQLISFDFGSEVIEISCGSNHTLALTEEGLVYGWGSNKSGQIGCPTKEFFVEPTRVIALKQYNIKTIICAGDRSFVLTVDGLVLSWGVNDYGQLGHQIEVKAVVNEPKIIDICNICSVGLSSTDTYFLTNDNTLYFCGLYESEEKTDLYQLIPKPIETDIKFESIVYLPLNHKRISIAIALSENKIYFIDYNKIEKTKHKNYLSYYAFERQMTYKTINTKEFKLLLDLNQGQIKGRRQGHSIRTKEEVSQVINQSKAEQTVTSSQSEQAGPSNVEQDQNIKEYEVLDRIGKGGYGAVFKVRNNIKNELFAVKLVKFESAKKEKVLREVHTLSTLRGDCIIRYLSSSIEENQLCIQMELCDESLKTIIDLKPKVFKRTEISPQFTPFEYFISSKLFKELLECIEYLHQTIPSLIHRDLKPENILVNYKSTNGKFLKVCDFGLATIQTYESMKQKSIVGTERYQAPEVKSGKGYDSKADIYSTGIIAMDLFGIDINFDESEKFNDVVKIAYKNVRDQIETMICYHPKKRPDCSSKLLSKTMEWSIDKNVVKQWPDFEATLNSLKEFENIFFYNYFSAKI